MTIDLDVLLNNARLVREAERRHAWLRRHYSISDPRYERAWRRCYARVERRRLTYFLALGYTKEEIDLGEPLRPVVSLG